MLHDLFLISTTMLIASALLCAVVMWAVRGRSRPKTVLAVASTLIFVYMAVMLAFYYLSSTFWAQKLVLSYSLVCITLVYLIYIYFRTLMQPWQSNRGVIKSLAWTLAAYTGLYGVLYAVCRTSPGLYTFGDIAGNLNSPIVWLRMAAFLHFVALFVVACCRAFKMYFRHRRNIAAQFSYRENISLSWVPYLLVLYTLYGAWTLFDQFISGEVGWVLIASNFIYSGFYLTINFLGLRQRDIFSKEDSVPNGNNIRLTANGMSAGMRDKLKKGLEELMERQHAYRNPTLRLDGVARMLNTNRTYLWSILREDFGDSFIGFVNRYRISEAKALFAGNDSRPVAEISETVGFKSISSFNEFFKKETGMSPAQYRKSEFCKKT